DLAEHPERDVATEPDRGRETARCVAQLEAMVKEALGLVEVAFRLGADGELEMEIRVVGPDADRFVEQLARLGDATALAARAPCAPRHQRRVAGRVPLGLAMQGRPRLVEARRRALPVPAHLVLRAEVEREERARRLARLGLEQLEVATR